jgi:hypothetical protein
VVERTLDRHNQANIGLFNQIELAGTMLILRNGRSAYSHGKTVLCGQESRCERCEADPQIGFRVRRATDTEHLTLRKRTRRLENALIVYVGDLLQQTEEDLRRFALIDRGRLKEVKEALAQLVRLLSPKAPMRSSRSRSATWCRRKLQRCAASPEQTSPRSRRARCDIFFRSCGWRFGSNWDCPAQTTRHRPLTCHRLTWQSE